MRTHGFRLFAITSMLALLTGSQLCMLVQCAPRRPGSEAHACCAAKASRSADGATKRAAEPPASSRPCCIQVTTTHAPVLDPPAAPAGHAPAALRVALQFAAAPRAAFAPPARSDDDSPPQAPPHPAAGSRAPPLG